VGHWSSAPLLLWPIVTDVLFRPPDTGGPSQSVNELKKNISAAAADVTACGKTLNTLAMPAQSRLSL